MRGELNVMAVIAKFAEALFIVAMLSMYGGES
jgi:hypothetical protein